MLDELAHLVIRRRPTIHISASGFSHMFNQYLFPRLQPRYFVTFHLSSHIQVYNIKSLFSGFGIGFCTQCHLFHCLYRPRYFINYLFNRCSSPRPFVSGFPRKYVTYSYLSLAPLRSASVFREVLFITIFFPSASTYTV